MTLSPLNHCVSRAAYDPRELVSGIVCAGDLGGEIDTCIGRLQFTKIIVRVVYYWVLLRQVNIVEIGIVF